MKMVAKRELTASEQECAARLKQIWKRKRATLGLTQEKVAYACGWATQGAFGHYLQGKNPLNIDAVFKLAHVLEVDPREIMPDLHGTLTEFFPELGDVSSEPISEEVMRVALSLQRLPPKERATLQKVIDAFAQQVEGDLDQTDCG